MIYCKDKEHCHYTRKYQGATYSKCNVRYKENSFIPLMAIDTSPYDNYLLLRDITKKH